jgi:hypothetical protein
MTGYKIVRERISKGIVYRYTWNGSQWVPYVRNPVNGKLYKRYGNAVRVIKLNYRVNREGVQIIEAERGNA